MILRIDGALLRAAALVAGLSAITLTTTSRAVAEPRPKVEHPIEVSGTWEDPKLGTLEWSARVDVSAEDQTIAGIVDVVGHPEYQRVDVHGTIEDTFVRVRAVRDGKEPLGTFEGTFDNRNLRGRLRADDGREFRGASSWKVVSSAEGGSK